MTSGRAWVKLWASLGLMLLSVVSFAEPPTNTGQTADARQFEDQFRPLLSRHCLDCHSGEKPKGKLGLDNLIVNFTDAATRKRWAAVIKRLRAAEMPPKEQPRPTEKEIQALTEWLSLRAADADSTVRATEGRVVLRRLNRVEYENTVRDLLGITIHFKEQLPQDGSADGFDNASAAHHTSSFLMEKYLEAADTALNMAIANSPKPPPMISKQYSMKDMHPVKSSTEDVYRFLNDGETRFPSLCLSCEGYGLSWTKSGAPVPTENWTSSVFAKLFLKGRPDEVAEQARRLADGQSILDAVRGQAKKMEHVLGAGDREKLDEYFTSVRELERRLLQADAWSKKPKPKIDVKPFVDIQNSTDVLGKTRLWFDLIHLALQTDSTRLVTLQLLGTSGVPPIPGVTQGHHDLCNLFVSMLQRMDIEADKFGSATGTLTGL